MQNADDDWVASGSGGRGQVGMTNPVLEVHALSPADWKILRATRLRALLGSPEAYASTYSSDLELDECRWRERLEVATWLVARDGRTVIGLAGLLDGSGTAPHLESIWVAPGYRRLGVFRALVDRVVEIGRETGWESVYLWVVSDNHLARCVYTSVGFAPTGEVRPLPSDSDRVERRLRLDLRQE